MRINFNMKRTAILLIILILMPLSIHAQRYTSYGIYGGVYGGMNLYSSDFSQLGSVTNLSPGFNSALGFGWQLSAGMEHIPEDPFLGMNIAIRLGMSFTDLSAPFSEEEFIGHIIEGNDYGNAYVEHSLEPDIKLISVDPSIYIYPLESIPVGIKAGFIVGFPIVSDFSQEERLLRPEGIYYDENGSRTQNEYKGEIPNAASYYLAASAGLSYRASEAGPLKFDAELIFRYGFNDLTENADWKAHSLFAGIKASYRIPKPALKPPASAPLPPMPAPPAPPEPGKLELALKVSSGGREIIDEDILKVGVHKKTIRKQYSVMPEIFFGKDSDRPLNSSSGALTDSYQKAQGNIIKASAEYLNNNPEVKVDITAWATADERPGAAESRVERIKSMLGSKGVDEARLSVTMKTFDEKLPYDELYEERRIVRLSFSDGIDLIPYTGSEIEIFDIVAETIEIEPQLETDGQKTKLQGEIYLAGKKIESFGKEGTDLVVDNIKYLSGEGKSHLKILADVSDYDEQHRSDTVSFSLEKNIISSALILNPKKTGGKTEKSPQEIIIGWCEFDRSAFYAVDREALAHVRKALEKGYRVEILPLTDNLGEEEHNASLARKRAQSALELLGSYPRQLEVVYSENPIFDNATPWGRKLNRTVLARILP